MLLLMLRSFIPFLAVLALAGPGSAETLAGLDLAPGDRLVWTAGGQQFTETVEAVSDGVATIRSSRDGTYAQPLQFVLPPVRWAGGPDGTGSTQIVASKGELFPLAPDKRLSITYRGVSDLEPEGWTAVRVCSVGAASEIVVPAGRFAVLPVACQERSRSRTWMFAPALGLVVYYSNTHRLGKDATEELVAVERVPRP